MNHIVSALHVHAQKKPQDRAILYLQEDLKEGAELNYAELDSQAKKVAAQLQRHQLAGKRILLLYPAGVDFVVSLFGCWYAGAVAVPISCPQPGEFKKNEALINSLAQDADISAIMTLSNYASDLESVLDKAMLLLCTDALDADQPYIPIPHTPDQIAYLQYSSGSTSMPKAAVVTHANLTHSLKETIKAWHYTKHSVTVNWAPHSHVYGLVCGLLVPLYHGTPAIIMAPSSFISKPELWLCAISKYKGTHGGCPNFGYELCLKSKRDDLVLDLSHWQVAVNGGDVVLHQTMVDFAEQFSACGFKPSYFSSAYGMSELAGAIAVTPFGSKPKIKATESSGLVSSGRLLKGITALIVDPATGLPLADGETGEVWLSGASVVKGYWQREQETKAVFHARIPGSKRTYFRTGDLGCLWQNELYLTGRLKEVIIQHGKKYYPLDLEKTVANALSSFSIHLPQAAFSTSIKNKEQIVVIQEIPELRESIDVAEIQKIIQHSLTKAYGIYVYEVLLVEKGFIPKTNSGKLQRKKCEELYKNKAIVSSVPNKVQNTQLNEEVQGNKKQFIRIVADILELEPQDINMSLPLSHYHFDSVNIIQVAAQLNHAFHINLSPAILYEYSCLEDFYQKIINEPVSEHNLLIEDKAQNQSTDIAIIGMSGLFPKAPDVDTFWSNLCEGKNCISEVPDDRWRWQDLTVKWGGFIEGIAQFDAGFFNISPREAELIDPQQRLFLQTTWKTIEDAGYSPASVAAVKTGLFVGVFNHDYAELLQDNDIMDPYITTGTMNSMIANRISYVLNLRGPSETIDTACSSSLVAIHHAVQAILNDDCELAIAGGVNTLITPTSYVSANQAGMLSPDGLCKTFDKSANGYVRGEGVGAILLKKLDQAMQDGDNIYGVIKGTAINHGGHVNTLTAPNPNAQAEVICSACSRAQVPIDSIQYIETHGTGTPLGDPIEINGLKKAFLQLAKEQHCILPKQYCALGAVKTHIGHLESAAGIAGVIKILLAMKNEHLPANLHLQEVNPYIELTDSPFYLLDKAQPWPKSEIPRRAGVSSFGFGGANAHLIIEEGPHYFPNATQEASFVLITLSAKTEVALRQKAMDLQQWLNQTSKMPSLKALSFTLNTGRQNFEKRCCFIVDTIETLRKHLTSFLAKEEVEYKQEETAQLTRLAQQYLQGQDIDWQAFYGDYQERIALPTYPFAKEHYWIKKKEQNSPAQRPLVYSKQLRGDEFYLLEHLVNEHSVLPGMMSLEIACSAMTSLLGKATITQINNVLWKKPIKADDLLHPLHITLTPDNHQVSFQITSLDLQYHYVEGEIYYDNVLLKPLDALDRASLKTTLKYHQTPQATYEYFKKAGLAYGPHFQVIQGIDYDENQLLARLNLKNDQSAQEFLLHPCLLDGILQTTQVLLKDKDALYLPFSVEHMSLYKTLPSTVTVYAQLTSTADNDQWPAFDIQVFDEEDGLVMSLHQFTLAAQKPKHATMTTRYYQPVWVEKMLREASMDAKSIHLLGTDELQIEAIKAQLHSHTLSSEIKSFTQPNSWHIPSSTDYLIVALEPLAGEVFSEAQIEPLLERNYYFIHQLAAKLIAQKGKKSVQIIALSRSSSIFSRALVGFAKTLHQEQSQVSLRLIEYVHLPVLADELSAQEIHVRYDEQDKRFSCQYKLMSFAEPHQISIPFKKSAVYLITGGLGGLGYLMATYLATTAQAKLVLTGRRAMTPELQLLITQLEQIGASVLYVQADVANQAEVEFLMSQTKQHFGSIHGIIHAAGLTQDAYIIKKELTQAATVLAPKIQGTYYLHQATREEPLDFFLMCSSVAALLGNAGQSDYAYANAFMDEFAGQREQLRQAGNCKGLSLSINWPLWEEGGIKLSSEYQALLERDLGIVSLSTEKGLSALVELMHFQIPHCAVLSGDQDKLVQVLEKTLTLKSEQPLNQSVDLKLHNKTEVFLKEVVSNTLKCDPSSIESHLPFEHYGIDSLMILQLNQALAPTFNKLPKTLFFEYQNLADLTDYFLAHHAAELSLLFSLSIGEKRLNSESTTPSIDDRGTTSRTSYTDIAIIGMDGRYPEAKNLAEFWQHLKSGKDCITQIPEERWDREHYYDPVKDTIGKTYSQWGGFLADVDHFDPLFFNISPREAALMDPQERLFLQTAWNTIEDAGYAREHLAGKNIGVYVGVMYGQYQLYGHETPEFAPTNSVFASIANRVSYFFDFHGPSLALDTMCSSSMTALHLACKSIQDGECQLALAGGVNLSVHPNKYLLLSHGQFLSTDGYCRSFGEDGTGYVPGEGVGAVLLKPLEHALADGDRIYAVIKGSHLNHGGKTNGYTVPNPHAQAEVIAETYRRAKVNPAQVSYVEAHGTGTVLGDPIEIAGLNKAFHSFELGHCALGSVKSNIGHCESAAGIAALTKVVLQLHHKTLVPSLWSDRLNSNVDWDSTAFRVQQSLAPWNAKHRIAGISSFGAGGSNAHVIVSEAPVALTNNHNDKPCYLLTLSAKTPEALQQRMADLVAWFKANPDSSLAHIAYTLNQGRSHFEHRCAWVAHSLAEAQTLLEQKQVLLGEVTDKAITQVSSQWINQLAQPHLLKESLYELGQCYIKGEIIPWDRVHEGESNQKIALPTYPFAKESYWYNKNEAYSPQYMESADPKSKVIDVVKKQVMTLLKLTPQQVIVNKSLGDYGMDSVHFVALAKHIADYYQIEFTPAVFYTHSSVEDISQYLIQHCADAVQHVHQEKIYQQPVTQQSVKTIKQQTAANEAIAIIGVHGMFPKSKNLEEFWQHLLEGYDFITEIPQTRWDWRAHYSDVPCSDKSNSKWGSFIDKVDEFDASFFNISNREASFMDPQQRLLLETSWSTIEDAGYDPYHLPSQQVGVFIGVEFNDYNRLLAQQQTESHGFIATGNSLSLLANRISYFFNFHGPSEVVDTACSSSLVAIHRAVQALRLGECDMALAGGVSLNLTPETSVVISQLGAFSSDGRCKTFDKSANGYVKGEGVATLLLKTLTQAQADGDPIYAVIRSSAVNHGGKAQSLTAPNAKAQSDLLIKTYQQAAVDPGTITYIETHGTGTSLGDPVEIEGLKLAFSQLLGKEYSNARIGLGSVKTNIGHLEPASGVVGVIKTILSMAHETLPRLLHLNELNPYIELDNTPFYIAKEQQSWKRLIRNNEEIPLRAGVSSFGFGGTNAHLVIEEGKPYQNARITPIAKPYYLVSLSAKQQASLQQKISDLHEWLVVRQEEVSLANLSYTLAKGRAHFTYRVALVVASVQELIDRLTAIINEEMPDYCIRNEGQTHFIPGPVLDEVYQSALVALRTPENTEHYRYKLFVLADLYTKLYPIDWDHLFASEQLKRLASLPAYPFIKQSYWYEVSAANVSHLTNLENKHPIQTTLKASAIGNTDLPAAVLTYLKTLFAEQLRTAPETIDENETYEVYGVDSLIGLEITNRLEKDFGTLPKTILYERNKLKDLASYFIKNHKQQVLTLLNHENLVVSHEEVESTNAQIQPLAQKESSNTSTQDIAIIGLHGTFPMANNLDEFWHNLASGRDCVGTVPADRWDYKEYTVTLGNETKDFPHGGFIPDVDKFDPMFFNISPRDAGLMDPQERLFMQCVWSTLEDAGYTKEKLKLQANNSVGVFAGMTYNFYPLFAAEEWQKGNRVPLDIQTFSLANRISYFLDLNGPSFVIDTACSSSLAAIHLACDSIKHGDCAMAIAGGVNLSLHPSKYHFLGSFSFMSEKGRCLSFAEGGTGYVPSEGVGAVLLKPLSQALADNDRIYGVIKGSSMNHGGKTSGYTVPNPSAQSAVIRQALDKAQIDARTISYIEAHGTGTALGDPIEIRGLQDAFEEFTQDKQYCAIGSVKSNIGHLESAAGISQLAKVLLQMQHRQLVPSIHTEQLNSFIDFQHSPFYVQRELQDWHSKSPWPRRAGLSSFGAGGANVHMIVEEYVPDSNVLQPIKRPFLFVLSALNEERLAAQVQQMAVYLEQNEAIVDDLWLRNACYTLQTGREAMTARIAVVVNHPTELLPILLQYPKITSPNVWTNPKAQKSTTSPTDLAVWIKENHHVELAQYWVNGGKIDWTKCYQNPAPQIISLPTYAFAKRRCWIPTKAAEKTSIGSDPNEMQSSVGRAPRPTFSLGEAVMSGEAPDLRSNELSALDPTSLSIDEKSIGSDPNEMQSSVGRAPRPTFSLDEAMVSGEAPDLRSIELSPLDPTSPCIEEWLYLTHWESNPIIHSTKSSLEGKWLIFSDREQGLVLQQELAPEQCIYCFVGDSFQKLNEHVYYINPANKEDYQLLVQDIHHAYGQELSGVLYLASAIEQGTGPICDPSIALLACLKALVQQPWKKTLLFSLISQDGQQIESESINIWQHYLWSMTRIFGAEQANFNILLVDLDSRHSLLQNAKLLIRELNHYQAQQNHVAYRGDTRYTQRFIPHPQPKVDKDQSWAVPEAALITGGLGALGYEVAEFLIAQGTRNLLLTGATELSDKTLEKNHWLSQLQSKGAQVHYAAVDVADMEQMADLIKSMERSWGKSIEGVFHLAGITTDNVTIAQMDEALWIEVHRVKVQGSLVLHELFLHAKLKNFVLFSSIAAVPHFGMSGLSAYAAANEFMSGLALYRRSMQLPASSLNWVAWSEKGMSHRHNHDAFLEAVGMASLSIKEGMALFAQLLQLNPVELTICRIQWQKFLQINASAKQLDFFDYFVALYANKASATQTLLSADEIEVLVPQLFAKVMELDYDEIEYEIPFQNYGMDSILGINYSAELGLHFPDVVAPMDLYRYPTIKQLTQYITQSVCKLEELCPQETVDCDESMDLDHMDYDQLNHLLEAELKELESIYD